MSGPELFMAEVERVCARFPGLEPLAGGILAAAKLDVVHDSHGFARTFGVEHALVLRAANRLTDAGLLSITRRSARNQRAWFEATGLFRQGMA